jgi:hypothetical protein
MRIDIKLLLHHNWNYPVIGIRLLTMKNNYGFVFRINEFIVKLLKLINWNDIRVESVKRRKIFNYRKE